MKHIYKAGGIRKTESGAEYSIKAVNDNECADLLKKGWVLTIKEVEPKTKEEKPKAKVKEKKTKGD